MQYTYVYLYMRNKVIYKNVFFIQYKISVFPRKYVK